ncbi:MAG TPA: penicillin-binding protein 2 [bacterium]|nr:penicillin-binding protein 2 [bacterium]
MDRDLFEHRLAVLFAVISGLLVVLALRLWQIQIVQGEYFLRQSEENRLRLSPVEAPRGHILDRQGRPLTLNRPAFTVSLLPMELRHPERIIPEIGRRLGMTPVEVASKLAEARGRPFEPVRLKRDVPKEVIAALEEDRMDLPGVFVQVEPVRDYPYGPLAAHLLGYLGEINDRELDSLRSRRYEAGELIGKDGVERIYDRYLKGRNGQIQAEVDAQGHPLRVLATVPSQPGNNVKLGVDLDVQKAAEEALGSRVGAVVAMDPRDGTIVALASHPAFDPNLFATGITTANWNRLLRDPLQPLLDRSAQGGYPMGSVFKIVTATAALELGLVQTDSRFYCPGYYNLGGHIFHDHEAHGNINFLEGIAQSCNVVFWTLARPVGPGHLAQYARMYALGQRTGIDLVQESAGVVPDPDWKRRVWKQIWFAGDTLNTAVGQGYVLATPLQVARLLAAVANGGTLVTPHLATEIVSPKGRVVARIAPPPAGEIHLRPETWAVLHAGLAAVVTHGTAASIQIPGLAIAGKTGTAENPHGKPHAWFAGYAPADHPQLVVVAIVENAGFGAEFAAPIVKRVFEAAFGIQEPVPGAPKP